jgi:hypothetical protein
VPKADSELRNLLDGNSRQQQDYDFSIVLRGYFVAVWKRKYVRFWSYDM